MKKSIDLARTLLNRKEVVEGPPTTRSLNLIREATPRACTPEELRRMRFSAGPEPFTRTVVRAFPDGNRVQVFLIEEPAVQSACNVSPD